MDLSGALYILFDHYEQTTDLSYDEIMDLLMALEAYYETD